MDLKITKSAATDVTVSVNSTEVTVQKSNNVVVEVTPQKAETITIDRGVQGAPGVGVPTGGTTGQVLAKASNTNYDTAWVAGGGGSGTVTSVAVTGGTTGLTTTGSPITTSGTIALGGTLALTNGGTGATTASGARTNLGLGSAATTSSTDYATAAQGVKADNAISDVTSTDGSVTVNHTGTVADLSVAVAASTTNVIVQVRNTTGATLTKGTVVYMNGATGQIPTVTKALATSDATSAQSLGMMTADLANNSNGYVTIIGLINDIDTSAFTDGAQLYLSGTTAGAVTTTKPKAPIHLVYVGLVEYAHPVHGKIFVKVQNGYELDEIHDVQINSPANGQTIIYDATASLWKNANLTAGTGVSVTNGASSITLTNTAPDQVVSLTAGSNVTITGTYPSFTIASTGGGGGGVTSVTGTAPVVSSGGTTPAISMPAATSLVSGYLTSTDWSTFNGKYSTGGALGTPASGTLTNCTGYTYANLSGTVPTWNQNTTGNAATVTNGVYTTGSYSNPAWITSISGSIVSGAVASATTAGSATTATSATSATTSTNIAGGTATQIPYQTSASTTGFIAAPSTSSYLQWNGTSYTWSNPSGAGTVSSVALSMPSGFSVSGSPITSSGTLAVTTSLSGILKGNGTGFTTATSGTDYAPATSGTSILYGNGSGGFSNVTIGSGLSFTTGTLTATGGGGGTPAGLNTQVQYNNSGAFGASSSFTFDGVNVTSPEFTATASTSASSANGAFAYGTLGYSDTDVMASFQSSVNSYNQVVLQNTNAGASASTNFNVSNNNGTATTNYGELGINSSGFSGTGSFGAAGNVYLSSASTDLAIGTYGANAIHFVTNNSATDAMTINTNNAVAFNGAYGTSGQVLISGGSAATPTWTATPTLTGTNFTGIPNGALTNNAITFGATSQALGSTVSALNAVSVGSTTASTGRFSSVTTIAGTASIAPINLTSGTNLTTATAGAVEYDGTALYMTPFGTSRGYVPATQIQMLTTAYTLTSQTAAQKLLNATTNGAVTLAVGLYEFECQYFLLAMSATAGSFGFALGGTATITQQWQSWASKGNATATTITSGSTNSVYTTINTAANTTLTGSSTTVGGGAFIKGFIRVTGAGTVIPQVSLTVASAATVQPGSYFKITPVNATSTTTTIGNWS